MQNSIESSAANIPWLCNFLMSHESTRLLYFTSLIFIFLLWKINEALCENEDAICWKMQDKDEVEGNLKGWKKNSFEDVNDVHISYAMMVPMSIHHLFSFQKHQKMQLNFC